MLATVPDWLTDSAAAATAVTVLVGFIFLTWRKAIKPVVDGVGEIRGNLGVVDEAAPILKELIQEFKPNGKPGIKDTIHAIDAKVTDLADRLPAVAAKQEKFESYMHDRMHQFANSLSIVQGTLELHAEGKLKTRSEDEETP